MTNKTQKNKQISYSTSMTDEPVKKDIALPVITEPLAHHTYIRPYRSGGVRLELETINDKNIFHNYGQGGSVICMAYGCATISILGISRNIGQEKNVEIAVLGAGINGLMTALELAKRNYHVTIYAQSFPKYEEKNPKKRLSSQIKSHIWYPGYYENSDPLKHELICKLSFDYYKDCMKNSRYQSISPANFFTKGSKNHQFAETITQFISEDYRNTYINFGNGLLEEYLGFKSLMIDAELFLEELLTEAKLRACKLVQRKFSTLEDVLSLKQNHMVNCLGMSSKYIFDDKELKGIRGHLIEYPLEKAQTSKPYMIRYAEEDKENELQIYVTQNRLYIGNIWENTEEKPELSEEQIQKIISSAYSFIKYRRHKPYKL